MKLKIKNFIIQEDRNGFILEEYGDKKQKDWSIVYWLKDITYPSTLENALQSALHKYKWQKTEVLEFENYIKEIKEINDDFLKDLKANLK